jgi:hypothetical protein
MDLINAMVDSFGLPKSWCGKAILATCFVLNQFPSINVDKIPYERWKGRKPTLGFFACMGVVVPKLTSLHARSKQLRQKIVDYVFRGYEHNSATY